MWWGLTDTAFEILSYKLSYIELIGTSFGLISVWFASKANVLTWPTGIVNEAALFMLFYNVQLYADMFLQIFFFVVTITGWHNWKNGNTALHIKKLNSIQKTQLLLLVSIAFACIGFVIKNIHTILPQYFPQPAAYPFADSFIMVLSIAATVLLASKHLENWLLWIVVDIVATIIYYYRGIYFLSAEYLIFLGIATYGFINWQKKLSNG